MREFRFSGLGAGGQAVQGTIFAESVKIAKDKVGSLAKQHGFNSRKIEERVIFKYRVKHPNGKTVDGEQKAFSVDEIESALRKMGLEVVSVRKKLFNFQPKPPNTDVIMFVRLASNLLNEKLPFDEILNLLVGDISSKSLRQVIRDLNADLKGGMDAEQAYMKHQGLLGKFTAYMLGIASKSGNMAEIYESTARFLERKDEFRKSVKSAMVTPAITLLALAGAFIFYIWYIFPQTAELFEGFGIELPPLTQNTLLFSRWLDRNIIWLGIALVAAGGGLGYWARTTKGIFWLDKNMIKIPVIGSLLHKLNIEVYCRVFSVLYSGSGDNLQVINVAAEACGNTYMEHQIKTIMVPQMMAQGTDLVRAMENTGVFTSMTVARFRSGAETGNVRKSALQMADYYEKETTFRLKSAIETIQTVVALIITILITVLTVISSEIALVSPSSSDVMGF